MRKLIILLPMSAVLLFTVFFLFGSFSSVDVKIKEVEPFSMLSMRHQGSYAELGGAINNLMFAMQQQSIGPTGPLIAIFHVYPSEDPADQIDWEIGFPVTEPLVVRNRPDLPRLEKFRWEYSTVSFAVHNGPYSTANDTIDAMFDWLEENGYEQTGPLLGTFLTMPLSESDATNMKVEFWIPCEEID